MFKFNKKTLLKKVQRYIKLKQKIKILSTEIKNELQIAEQAIKEEKNIPKTPVPAKKYIRFLKNKKTCPNKNCKKVFKAGKPVILYAAHIKNHHYNLLPIDPKN